AIYLTDNDMDILKETQTVLVHNPCSNMKLASGIFPSKAVSDKGLTVILGTDGSSSNNNLDMREEMKFAALMAKLRYGAEALPATQVLQWATADAAAAFGIDAGVIAEGKLADAVIVNLKHERMTPSFNLTSNWVYSADSSVIDSVLCDGRFLMRHGRVSNEDQIRENAERCAFDLLKRVK
ncbi:MAG: amidohydrolase family protein, partial [Bacteroidales bacterium]|nr:amidohydrolase family protein [Bacteroidales bacterium]